MEAHPTSLSSPKKAPSSPKWLGAWVFLVQIAVCISTCGCSVFLAATQPPRKNIALLAPGTSRAALIAEFGTPSRSRLVDWKRVDIFTFTQGYSRESRAGRAIAHGTADVLTGGLWELAGTPTEMIFSGDKISYEVTYDSTDHVARVARLSD